MGADDVEYDIYDVEDLMSTYTRFYYKSVM